MLTVLEAVNLSTGYLEKKGIESSRTNAELLLAHILNTTRLNLYLSFDRPLTEDEVVSYRELLKRRGNREPLQYIIGSVDFYGLKIKVTKDVLIPRPETELLVEEIIRTANKVLPIKILDIGVGSGNIAISLLKNLPNALLTAIDSSDSAIAVAEENAVQNFVREKISFYKENIFSERGLAENEFDIVVSNPPYISKDDYTKLEPELRLHEPEIALTDGNDGFQFYRRIIPLSKKLLKKDGKLFLELGQGQHSNVKNIFEENNFSEIVVIKDYQNIERIISGVNN